MFLKYVLHQLLVSLASILGMSITRHLPFPTLQDNLCLFELPVETNSLAICLDVRPCVLIPNLKLIGNSTLPSTSSFRLVDRHIRTFRDIPSEFDALQMATTSIYGHHSKDLPAVPDRNSSLWSPLQTQEMYYELCPGIIAVG